MPSASTDPDAVFPSNRKFLPNYGGTDPALNRYAVIFDAGSSGSRVHVYCFDQNLDLVHMVKSLRFSFRYANDPKGASDSLRPLIEKAEKAVPEDMRRSTPVKLGATAGLRQLGFDESEKILRAVKEVLKESKLKADDKWVSVLDGTQEAAYQWVSINYLLKTLGKKYSDTVGVVDLGGGSVQMAYAISEEDAAKAPKPSNGQDPFVKEMLLMGTKYYLYVHSYLHYGLLAARAQILGHSKDSDNPCILNGYHGTYSYGKSEYKVSSGAHGANMNKCREEVVKALKVNESICNYRKCSFDGVWDGGAGDGHKKLYVASYFFDRAAEVGLFDITKSIAKTRPVDFRNAAERVCVTRYKDANPYILASTPPTYPTYAWISSTNLDPMQEVTLVKKIKYTDALVEAAWPLGSAIEAVSANPT
ncbi:hypothetical protein OSB04_013522 [Centaurea solstitialis]|uniref:Apyrase n=1 Tax=Centaurea solstitialis TaxID=347529 RepID=A0AA38TY70_9ASTR|nr:hypothetical protein OSB04_013522 [Centaurea solstitialis]